MKAFNIYITGVGGQGIGLLSEIALRAADHAGHRAKAVDTHGLAQRGGIVVSQIRLGEAVHSPLIAPGEADLALALERHEALRAVNHALKQGGVLIYFDTSWQPLSVRLGEEDEATPDQIEAACASRQIECIRIAATDADLEDTRMQNVAVLAHVSQREAIPGVAVSHYRQAMADLMTGDMLDANLRLFESQS